MSYFEYLASIFVRETPELSIFGLNPTNSPVESFEEKLQEIIRSHKEICTFLSKVKACNCDQPPNDYDTYYYGYYISAFCDGIQQVIDEFCTDVGKLEQELFKDLGLTLRSISVSLDHISRVFPALIEAIHKIKKNKIRGCMLFDLIHLFTQCGNEQIENAFQKIQECCLQPYFMQVYYWIIKSELRDPHNEFFIKCSFVVEEDQDVTAASFVTDKTVASFVTDKTVASSVTIKKEIPKYSLDCEFLPDSIPLSSATKILFIGEYLNIFQRKHCFGDIDTSETTQCIDDDNILIALQNIFYTRPFSFSYMDRKINEIWATVNKDTRKLAEEVGKFSAQFLQMRDIYLLARGELFQEFLANINNVLDSQVSMRTKKTLNQALETAMYNVYLTDNTDLIGGIEFIIPKNSLSSRAIVKNIIEIDCKINWPLHYLFSPQVIDNYNKMFRFLLRVKKAQMDVYSVWMDINHISDIRLMILAIEIRNQLLALIGNLQNYCFTDVIANESNLLMFKVEKSDTYTELQTALTEFQSKVMRQLFLMTDKISTFFITIFDLCEIFSKLIHKSSSSSYIDTSLTMFKANLEKTIESMFNFFEKFETCVESPDVRNLLTNLDTNRYFRNKYCTP